MKLFGRIGKSLAHSYSQSFFTEKFEKERLRDCQYRLFELSAIDLLPDLIASEPDLCGFNVTIPYKKSVIPFLDELSPAAAEIGAVNVVKVEQRGGDQCLKGYNTDAEGFASSLSGVEIPNKALVLGTGGAASAVSYVLRKRGIPFLQVSRAPGQGDMTYVDVTEKVLRDHPLVINCTPVGTTGEKQRLLPLPYEALTPAHYLYDLVYNPEVTPFLEKGKQYGARTQNGLSMLHLQAEAAWRIWGSSEE